MTTPILEPSFDAILTNPTAKADLAAVKPVPHPAFVHPWGYSNAATNGKPQCPARPTVLVSLDWLRPGDPPFGLGVASIASALRSIDAEVHLVADAVNRPGFSLDAFAVNVAEAVAAAGRDALIGIGAFVWCEPEVQHLLKTLAPQHAIVLGGPQVSYVAAGELEKFYPRADYFIRGYGENAMLALAMGHIQNGHWGLHIAGAPDLAQRADYPLDDLPSPHLDGAAPIGDFVRWETQRGCSFQCTFCQHKQPGARLRRSAMGYDRLQLELQAFHEAGVRRVAVLDPIFNTNPDRSVRLLDDIKKTDLNAHWSLQCRFEFVNDEFLDAVLSLNATLEFGMQTANKAEALAVGRPNNMGKVEAVIDNLNCRRIPYEVSLIYGLPLQTLDSFRRSVDWLLQRGVPCIRAWPLMLLRGTVIYDQKEQWGYVESVGHSIPIVVESSTFSRAEHDEMARIANELPQTRHNTTV